MSKDYTQMENTIEDVRKTIYDPYIPIYRFLPPVDLTNPTDKFDRLLPLSSFPSKPPKVNIKTYSFLDAGRAESLLSAEPTSRTLSIPIHNSHPIAILLD